MIRELVFRDLSMWNCVWQSTLFAVMGVVGSFFLRRRPARASQVLLLAIITAVLLPVLSVLVSHCGVGRLTGHPITLQLFEVEVPEVEVPIETPKVLLSPEFHTAEVTAPAEFASEKNNLLNIEVPWHLIALYGWMAATWFLFGRLIIAFVSGIRVLRRAQSDCCDNIKQAADSARARLGISKCLDIRSSTYVRSPMIWCWNRSPVLLVPGDLNERVDWVDVICHELAHWRRWDHISGLIAELAVCILPWNPLLWWSKKRMVRFSEQACDDWALSGGCAGTDYAQSLLNFSPELQMAFLPTVIGKEKPMKKRIYRIIKEECGIPQVGARWALAVTVIAAILTVGVAFAQRRPARFERIEHEERIAAEQREWQALEEHRVDLEDRIHELRARFEQTRADLAELEDSGRGESDQAQARRHELRELEETMTNVERELQELEDQRHQREMRPEARQEPRREMLRHLEELGHEIELVLRGLTEQDFGRNEETNMLYGRMRELNEQMRQIRQQLGQQFGGTGRQRPAEDKILHLDELGERARQVERELEELGDKNPERAEKLHAELREIHGAIEQIEREVGASQEQGQVRRMRRRELQEHAQELECRLREIGDDHPDEAQELRMQLDQIHQQLQRIEREPGIPERPWPRLEEPMQPGGELHHRQLMARREELRAQLRETELILGELNEQGKSDSEEAQIHRQQLREFTEQLKATENELQSLDPDRIQDRDDLEREVQNLRKQMDGMNEQMGEMRELIKRLLEKGESSEAL